MKPANQHVLRLAILVAIASVLTLYWSFFFPYNPLYQLGLFLKKTVLGPKHDMPDPQILASLERERNDPKPWRNSLDGPAVWIRFSLDHDPSMGEPAVLICRMGTGEGDVLSMKVRFVELVGIELLGSPSQFETSLKNEEWKELRFKIRFISSPAYLDMNLENIVVRRGNGEIVTLGHGTMGRNSQGFSWVERDRGLWGSGVSPKAVTIILLCLLVLVIGRAVCLQIKKGRLGS